VVVLSNSLGFLCNCPRCGFNSHVASNQNYAPCPVCGDWTRGNHLAGRAGKRSKRIIGSCAQKGKPTASSTAAEAPPKTANTKRNGTSFS